MSSLHSLKGTFKGPEGSEQEKRSTGGGTGYWARCPTETSLRVWLASLPVAASDDVAAGRLVSVAAQLLLVFSPCQIDAETIPVRRCFNMNVTDSIPLPEIVSPNLTRDRSFRGIKKNVIFRSICFYRQNRREQARSESRIPFSSKRTNNFGYRCGPRIDLPAREAVH